MNGIDRNAVISAVIDLKEAAYIDEDFMTGRLAELYLEHPDSDHVAGEAASEARLAGWMPGDHGVEEFLAVRFMKKMSRGSIE